MENAIARINPNKELLEFSKYDSLLRKNGYTPMQIMAIKRMVLEVQRDAEWHFCQKLPLLIFSIVINVLHGNKLLSKKKIASVIQECCELYYEIDLSLLDMDDVIGYNEREAGITVELHKPELFEVKEDVKFKVTDQEPYSVRLRSVLESTEKRLNAAIEKDSDDEEAYIQLRFFKELLRDLDKAGVHYD